MENTLIPDLQINKPRDVVASLNDDRSSEPGNDYELRGAVGVDSDKSTHEEAVELHTPLETEKSAENDPEVNSSVATDDVALSQSDELLINQSGAVGIDFNKSPVEEITEMLKLLKVEEGSGENIQVNISDVALFQSDDHLIAGSSCSTLVDGQSSGSLDNFDLRGAVGVGFDISSGEETEQIPMVLEMEESAEKDLDVNGSGVGSVTLSQVNETSPGKDYELNISVAANDVAISHSDDIVINHLGAVGIEFNETTVAEIEEMREVPAMEENSSNDLESNISVSANDVAIAHSDDIVMNHLGAVGIEFNKTTVAEIEEMPEVLAVEESSGNDLESNISVSANDVAVSHSDDIVMNHLGAVATEFNETTVAEIEEMLEVPAMEESSGNDLESNISVSANDVAIARSDDIVMNHLGAVGIEFNKTTVAEIEEMPKVLAMEESSGNDLESNISVSANDVAVSHSDDIVMNHLGAVGIEFNETTVAEIEEMPEVPAMEESSGNDLESNISVSANDVAVSHSDDIVMNHLGAVGIEFNETTVAEIEEMPEVLAVEESSGNDLESNISVSNNNVAVSQIDDIFIAVSSSSTISEDRSSDEGIKQPELLEMEESAEKHSEMNRFCAANDITLFLSDDLLIHQIGADGIDSNKSEIEEIKEKPDLTEVEESVGNDLEANILVADNDVASCPSSDLLITVLSPSTLSQSSGDIIKEPELLNMEENAGNDLEVNTLSAAKDVALFQSTDLISHSGVVGTDFCKSACQVIKEMPKLPGLEDNDVALCQGDGLLVAVSSSSTLFKNQSSGEDTEKMPIVIEMEESAGKDYEVEESAEMDLEVTESGSTSSATLSQVSDLLINQVGVGTESDTSIGDDIEETCAGNDYEMEETAEKDLDVNGSGAASSATLSQVSDLLINQVGAVGSESDTSLAEDINETNAGKDFEVNISVAANDVAISHSDAIMIGAVGIEFKKTTDTEKKEMSEVRALEESSESSGNDLETNISVSNNDVALSQSDNLFIAVSSSTISEDQSSDDGIKQPELLEMEESAEKHFEMNRSCAANNVTLFLSDDLLINQLGADGTDSSKSAIEETQEKPALTEEEESVGNDLEANILVAANDVASSPSSDLLIAVLSPSTIADDHSSGEDIKEPELLSMEENAGNDLGVNILSAANDGALFQSTDLINHNGVVGTDFNKSTCEVIEEMPKLPGLEEGHVKDSETNILVADNDVALCQGDDPMITVSSSSSTLVKNQSSGEDAVKMPIAIEMEESAGNDYEVEESAEKDLEATGSGATISVTLSQVSDLLINQVGAVGTKSDTSIVEDIEEASAGNEHEMEQSVEKDLDVNGSGEDIQEPELLNMEENVGNDLEVNTLSAADDVALSQSTDMLHHNGVVGTDFNRSTHEVIQEMPKPTELEEGALNETNLLVADSDVTLCQGDDLLLTVSSSSSMLSENQSPDEDTEKMLIVLKTEDNDREELEMPHIEAVNNVVLSQSHDVLVTNSFPITVSDQQSPGHGNETRPELIGAVEIGADKPDSEGALEMPKLHVTQEPQKSGKNVKFNLRKSLAWDSAFFTSDGVLDADELSTMMEGGVKNAKPQLPGIEEEVYRSMDSISTLESDNLSLECLEAELFEDIRASIQKSNRSSSNLNNSSIKVSSGKKVSPAKVTSSSKKVDIDSGKRPAARMKHITSSIPQPKIVSRVNSSSTLTLTKRASLSAKKDQDIARQPHVIQKATQAAKTTTQGSKLIAPRRGVPKPSLSSKATPMGSSTAHKTELTRPSSSHSNSSSCSSGTDVKSSTTLLRKKTDSKSSMLTTTSVRKTPSRSIMQNKPQPAANSRLSSHSVLSSLSSSISPSSSISEWSLESSSSATNIDRRSESRGSIDTGVSYRSLDGDAIGQSALSIHPTGRISNQNGNQPISQSGSLARPPSVQPTGLRMPSPKIGFFDGGKSGARTPNGGNIPPQSKFPTGIPKTGATHGNPIISNGVKSGKLPPPKTGAVRTNIKPNPHKAAPKPSQEQPTIKDGSRTPFAVKNSEAY